MERGTKGTRSWSTALIAELAMATSSRDALRRDVLDGCPGQSVPSGGSPSVVKHSNRCRMDGLLDRPFKEGIDDSWETVVDGQADKKLIERHKGIECEGS